MITILYMAWLCAYIYTEPFLFLTTTFSCCIQKLLLHYLCEDSSHHVTISHFSVQLLDLVKYMLNGTRGVARGGCGVHMSPGAKVQGRQNEAYKTFTRVKTIVDYVNYL